MEAKEKWEEEKTREEKEENCSALGRGKRPVKKVMGRRSRKQSCSAQSPWT